MSNILDVKIDAPGRNIISPNRNTIIFEKGTGSTLVALPTGERKEILLNELKKQGINLELSEKANLSAVFYNDSIYLTITDSEDDANKIFGINKSSFIIMAIAAAVLLLVVLIFTFAALFSPSTSNNSTGQTIEVPTQ